MKFQLLFFIVLSFLWTGCTSNAFSKFHIATQKQRAFANLQISKISSGYKTAGTISAIYLNNIIPNKYKRKEYFYVILYLKNQGRFSFALNGNKAIKIQSLEQNNIYNNLLPISGHWHHLYLVIFNHVDDEHLKLLVRYLTYHSYVLRYLKNQ